LSDNCSQLSDNSSLVDNKDQIGYNLIERATRPV